MKLDILTIWNAGAILMMVMAFILTLKDGQLTFTVAAVTASIALIAVVLNATLAGNFIPLGIWVFVEAVGTILAIKLKMKPDTPKLYCTTMTIYASMFTWALFFTLLA